MPERQTRQVRGGLLVSLPPNADGPDEEVTVSRWALFRVFDALNEAYAFFSHRDLMNARVHAGSVRWSPITINVRTQKDQLQEILGLPDDDQ